MVIDAVMQKLLGKPFDRGGRVASAGTILPGLLTWMQGHPFIGRRPPKSTGREEFGGEFLAGIVRRSRKHSPRDIMATATEFTAWTVAEGVRRWGRGIMPSELVVSGGGTENPALMRVLERNFPHVRVVRWTPTGCRPRRRRQCVLRFSPTRRLRGGRRTCRR